MHAAEEIVAVILCVRSASLFNESAGISFAFGKCQKLFMKLSFHEKCENNVGRGKLNDKKSAGEFE